MAGGQGGGARDHDRELREIDAPMSLYELQKLIRDVNCDPQPRSAYQADKAGFVAGTIAACA